ncbi:LamG-like jellyroll fold domain-containing protein [Candidatus Omnitrophota bacterium]
MKKQILLLVFWLLLFHNGPLVNPQASLALALPEDYVAYYPFERNANDQSGAHDGNWHGDQEVYSERLSGNYALEFDGDGDYVEIADADQFSPGAFSISLWIKPATGHFEGMNSEGYVHFLGKANPWNYSGAAKQTEYKFRIYNVSNSANRPNRISFYVFNLTGGWGVGSYFQDQIDHGNEWIHVVGVYDGRYTYIYKNGRFRDRDDASSINVQNGTAPLVIGTGENTGYFTGMIDEVMVYDRALSAAEIQDIYDEQSRGGTVPPPPPDPDILYGDVSENGDVSAYDASLAAQYAVGSITLTASQITKADVTGNGDVSATDASWIARKAVNPDVEFPVED